MGIVDSDLSKDLNHFADHDNTGMCKLRVVLLVFIVLIIEFRSGDSVSKVHEELDY